MHFQAGNLLSFQTPISIISPSMTAFICSEMNAAKFPRNSRGPIACPPPRAPHSHGPIQHQHHAHACAHPMCVLISTCTPVHMPIPQPPPIGGSHCALWGVVMIRVPPHIPPSLGSAQLLGKLRHRWVLSFQPLPWGRWVSPTPEPGTVPLVHSAPGEHSG